MENGLLLVDDDETILQQMKWAFTDYTVHTAVNRDEALTKAARHDVSVVTLDLGLPPTPWDTQEGFLALSGLLELNPAIKVIVITGNTQKEHALKSVELGAFDFYLKPINIEELSFTIRRAFHISGLERQNLALQHRIAENEIIGASAPMIQVFRTIDRVAPTDVPVLITGESGTGKELVARAVWRKSKRRERAFVPINCGAIPEALLESELFGYEKGAFTGANTTREGLVEKAAGGTLFLDEIGEMPLSLQVKLLRFLQEKRIRRVGGNTEISVDIRVLAATNKDLKNEVSAGKFREDLYYRLAVMPVHMPPLRERPGDAVLLGKYFLEKFTAEHKKTLTGFDNGAKTAIEAYRWPGNIREVENKVKRAVVLAETDHVTADNLDLASGSASGALTLKDAREKFEREFLRQVLARHERNITNAAKELGVTRQNLHTLITKYDL